ncbi:MAG TPA: hypothetical protein VGA80_00375 [Flavobacteriaceae bacterium]|jgi:hypothetical protein
MKFEDSKYFKLNHLKVEKPFGNFYLCDKFYISEFNEGVHCDWEMVQDVVEEIIGLRENNASLGYISNRINSYSMDPQIWVKVHEEYDYIIACAIVSYNNMTFMNASLEKAFFKKSIKRCLSLDEAIEWVINLKELK